MDYLKEATSDFLSWVVASIGAAFVWIVRRVITNQKQIELLQSEIRAREEMRSRDREDLQEVKRDVKHLNQVVLEIFKADR